MAPRLLIVRSWSAAFIHEATFSQRAEMILVYGWYGLEVRHCRATRCAT